METINIPVQTGRTRYGRFRTHRPLDRERSWSVREEAFSHALLRIAQTSGERKGLPLEEAQDCGLGFVVHMLVEEALLVQVRAGKPVSPAWLHACAEHWTANFVRYRRRLYDRECLTAEMPEAAQTLGNTPSSQGAEAPEARMIRLELMQRLLAATLPLTDSQRDLFTLRYLEERAVSRRSPGKPDARRERSSRRLPVCAAACERY